MTTCYRADTLEGGRSFSAGTCLRILAPSFYNDNPWAVQARERS